MAKTITADMLRAKKACADLVAEFERRFPTGVTFTSEDDAVRQCEAVADVFDWNWAAQKLLTAALLAKYEKAEAPLWAKYEKARAPLWAEYEKARAPLFARLYWRK